MENNNERTNIEVSTDIKQVLEELATNNNLTLDELLHQLIREQPTGYIATTKVSKKNQVSLPSIIRKKYNIEPGKTLYWYIEDETIIIRLK